MKIKKGFKKPLLVTAAAAMTFGCLGGVANFASSSLMTFAASPSDPAYYKDGLAGLVDGFGNIKPTVTLETESLSTAEATVSTADELKAALTNGAKTIKFANDITFMDDDTLLFDSSSTIDLGGHTFTCGADTYGLTIAPKTDQNIKIMNGTITYAGTDGISLLSVYGNPNSSLTMKNIDLVCDKVAHCDGLSVNGGSEDGALVVNFSGNITVTGRGITSMAAYLTNINIGEFVENASGVLKAPLTTVAGGEYGIYSSGNTYWNINANVAGARAVSIFETNTMNIMGSYLVGVDDSTTTEDDLYDAGIGLDILIDPSYYEIIPTVVVDDDSVIVGTQVALNVWGDDADSTNYDNVLTLKNGLLATTNQNNPVAVFSDGIVAKFENVALFGKTSTAGTEYSFLGGVEKSLSKGQSLVGYKTDDGTAFRVIKGGAYDLTLGALHDGAEIPGIGDDGVESETPENPDNGDGELIGGGAGTTGGSNNNAGSNNPSGDSQKPNAGTTNDKETTIAVPKTGANNKSAAASSIDTTGFIATAVALLMLSLGYAGFRYFKNRY